MKTGFKQTLDIKEKKSGRFPFAAKMDDYDSRTGCAVSVGTYYGVGHNQPTGHTGSPQAKVDVLPHGKVNTLKLHDYEG